MIQCFVQKYKENLQKFVMIFIQTRGGHGGKVNSFQYFSFCIYFYIDGSLSLDMSLSSPQTVSSMKSCQARQV